ncbi:MAG: CAP domain-containing protein [Candidatus Paceibacterota bacterium]
MDNGRLGFKFVVAGLAIFIGLTGFGVSFLYNQLVTTNIKNGGEKVAEYVRHIETQVQSTADDYLRRLEALQVVGRIIGLSDPLVLFDGADNSDWLNEVTVDVRGVINQTNNERVIYGRTPLRENQLLNVIAETKVNDMFANQYFEHFSPTGEGVADLAGQYGYRYAVIGENLAQGIFLTSDDLVSAWMKSPGHRENILSVHYQEIGVAVAIGQFKDHTVMLAVQVFGKNQTVCLPPNQSLVEQITTHQAEINDLEETITERGQELRTKVYTDVAEREAVIVDYNQLVNTYNNLIQVAEAIVSAYNREVRTYNRCLGY